MCNQTWHCAKCGSTEFEHDEFRAIKGNFAQRFDARNKKFVTLSCARCGYTEVYKQSTLTKKVCA